MEEINSPAYLPPPAPGPSVGCFAKGCLTITAVSIVLLVMFGCFGWYVMRGLQPYLSQQPAEVRVYPATDTQYQTLEARIRAFVQTVKGGHHATLTLTADELNILVARDPQYALLRGKAYLAIAHDQICAETSTLLNEHAPEPQRFYFHGRVVFDASFSSGDFTVLLRRIEPLNGGPAPAMVTWALSQPNFSSNFNEGFNESFHDAIRKNPGSSAFFDRLNTIIVKDNQLVITALDDPGGVADKADQG